MTRPAIPSTQDPPVAVDNLLLSRYIAELRRRIEVQNDLMDSLALDIAVLERRLQDKNGSGNQEDQGDKT